MRSFIKSHRRGSSTGLEGDQLGLSLVTAGSGTADSPHSSSSLLVSPVLPIQTSPGRISGGSPSYPKTNKLQRLFQRNKSSSNNNLHGLGLNPTSPGKGTSPPPSIIGTRTHEWGSGGMRETAAKFTTRVSTSEKSSSTSLYSSSESNRNSTPSITNNSNRLTKNASNDDSDFLQLPLNTVLEIPDSISPSCVGSTVDSRKKNLHRRAQIVTADSPISQQLSPTLESPANPLPTLDASMFDTLHIDDDEMEVTQSYDLSGLEPAPDIVSTPAAQLDDQMAEKRSEKLVAFESPEADEKEVDDDTNSSHESEFSFEQDGITGRNMSIRYYKNPLEVEREQANVVREQGFYVDDCMEDDFDEEMNYFDEDDDYNDDEEIFNRKYFSDDEEEAVAMVSCDLKTSLGSATPVIRAETETSDPDPSSSITYTPHTDTYSDHTTSQPDQLHVLRPKRSLKYHQLPTTYEHEFSERRYSWLSDDENTSKGNQSYDSLLDEINNIPDDFDYEDNDHLPSGIQPRSKSFKSAIKPNQGVIEDVQQNTKFETQGKTVTLFHRSTSGRSSNSTRLTSSSFENGNSTHDAPDFGYLTPNNSFTSPHPLFRDQMDVELSPISEGSYYGDSTIEHSP